MNTRPTRMAKWLGKFADRNSNSSTSSTAPSSGPNKVPAPPSKAMISVWNEIAGANAIVGSR
ncbi:hypothetical protein D3C86_2018910 [compost metagenome]